MKKIQVKLKINNNLGENFPTYIIDKRLIIKSFSMKVFKTKQ